MGKLKTTKVRQAINVANRYSDVDMKEVSASKPVIKKRIEDILIDQNIEEHGENFLRVAKGKNSIIIQTILNFIKDFNTS